jgi:hypothetical protein
MRIQFFDRSGLFVVDLLAGIGVREMMQGVGVMSYNGHRSLLSFFGQNCPFERQITNKDVREIFGISNRAALDEISGLIELELIKQMGKGTSVHYVLL